MGNRFENSFSSRNGTTSRAIYYSSANYSGPTSQRGIIAVNHMENLQSRDYKEDADGSMASGFSQNNMFNGNLLFLGNVGVNAGKRTIKALSGGIDAHGNFSWWRDRNGPLGTRVTWTHYDGLGVSKTRWTNNIAITDASNPRSESYFMALQTHQFAAQYVMFDIVYKNNLYIHNDDTSEGRKSYVFRISDFDGSNTTDWPADSEISNNVIQGSGTVSFVWKYFGGNDPYGEQFKHENNLIELNFEAEYRPYPIR